MEFEDFENDKANLLCAKLADMGREIDASSSTMLFVALRLLMIVLKHIVVPDPKTGRKFERAMEMIPQLVMSFNNDFPMDEAIDVNEYIDRYEAQDPEEVARGGWDMTNQLELQLEG